LRTLSIIAIVLAVGALVTLIGAWLIGRAHPPRGRFVKVRRLRQHVVELGEAQAGAPPIVLIHGAGCNLEDMRLALGERLAARHRVILIDRPGMGWSKRKGRAGSSPADQAAILREILERLGVERAIIVGHSWGGALAASFKLDHPDRTAALALLAPPLYPFARGTTWLYALFATRSSAGFMHARWRCRSACLSSGSVWPRPSCRSCRHLIISSVRLDCFCCGRRRFSLTRGM
jgi:pimeloyl-ACP methyl ester carboxylesterase